MTLTDPFQIYIDKKPIITIYDWICASIFLNYYLADSNVSLKFGWKKINNYKELKLIYWNINELNHYIFWFSKTDYFIETNKSNLIQSNWDTIWTASRLFDNAKLYFSDIIWEIISNQNELNSQISDILEYWLYDDNEFNKLTIYYSKVLFNSSIEDWEKTTIKIGDYMLTISLEEADDIPDEIIDYVEQTVLWYDWFDTKRLKEIIKFEPRWWQRYFLISQKRFSYIVSSRKAWKSYLMAYLVLRQLLCKNNQDIVYVIPDFTAFEQPFDYLVRFIQDFWDSKLRFDRSRRTISYDVNRSVIRFVSGESNLAGRSKRADLLVYDEASFVSDKIEKTIRPLIANSEGWQIAVSTPSPDTPINRFYFWFKKWELWIKENYFSMRIDLYKNPFISENEKLELLDYYKNDEIMLMTELLAMFPSSSSWFNIKDFFIHYSDSKKIQINWSRFVIKDEFENLRKEYKQFIIWYDPAKMRDKWWVSIIWVKEYAEQDWWLIINRNMFEIIWWWYMSQNDYSIQIDTIIDIKRLLEWDNKFEQCKVEVAMDYTWVWVWVYELALSKWLIGIHRIRWTGSVYEATQDNWVWKVWKKDLESIFRVWMGDNLFWYNFLEELKSELETYWLSTKVDGSHFDQLSAWFVAFFIWKRFIWDYVWTRANASNEDYIQEIYDMFGWTKNYIQEEYNQATIKKKNDRFRRFIY